MVLQRGTSALVFVAEVACSQWCYMHERLAITGRAAQGVEV